MIPINCDPLVSVHFPVFNNETNLVSSLESLLNQTYKNFEIVVGDDFSQDNCRQILELYQKKFPSVIKVIFNIQNIGMVENFNNILKNCAGEYIVFSTGDDLFYPKKISKMVKLFQQNKSLKLVGHKVDVLDSKGNKLKKMSSRKMFGIGNMTWVEFGAIYAAASIMIKYDPDVFFDKRVPILNDQKFWVDIIGMMGHFKFINETLGGYRKSKDGITSKPLIGLRETRKLYNYYKEVFPNNAAECNKGYYRNYRYALARHLAKKKKSKLARKIFWTCVVSGPDKIKPFIRIIQTYLGY